MTEDLHKRLVSEFNKGQILIELDRVFAREFFMDHSLKKIANLTVVSAILCNRVIVYCCGIRSSNMMVNRFNAAFQF